MSKRSTDLKALWFGMLWQKLVSLDSLSLVARLHLLSVDARVLFISSNTWPKTHLPAWQWHSPYSTMLLWMSWDGQMLTRFKFHRIHFGWTGQMIVKFYECSPQTAKRLGKCLLSNGANLFTQLLKSRQCRAISGCPRRPHTLLTVNDFILIALWLSDCIPSDDMGLDPVNKPWYCLVIIYFIIQGIIFIQFY